MARIFEVNIRVTIDSKCKDSDDDIIESLMYGADKYFYPHCSHPFGDGGVYWIINFNGRKDFRKLNKL